MNREILFRGKRLDNSEWVEGGYFQEPYTSKAYIICWNSTGMGYNEFIEVGPSTVGQYTGLKDRNGKRIFEGDIVRFCGILLEIAWKGSGFETAHIEGQAWTFPYLPSNAERMEIIGNIHDNPELVREAEL